MEHFSNKGKCRVAVVIEMILSGLTLALFFLFFIGMILHFSQDTSFLDMFEEGTHPMEEVMIFLLRMVVLLHLMVLVLVFFAGHNVLSKACYLSTNATDSELSSGVKACKVFCRLEAMRMVLIVITFMGELSIFNLSIVLELVRNVFNVPVLFGWFFASEFQKELESRLDQVTRVHCLYTLPNSFPSYQNQNQCRTSDHCDTNFYNIPARETQEHLGTFMNTTPAVAYFLSNSNVLR